MNKSIESFARSRIKELLAECTEGQQTMFKRMYAAGDMKMDINDVVDSMPSIKLNHAMDQCERTVAKNEIHDQD